MANIHRLSNYVKVKQVFAAAPTNATQTATTVDTLGYRRLTFLAHIKTGSATTVKLQVQESPDDNSNYVVVTGSDQPASAQLATNEAIYLIEVDLQGARKRYQQVTIIGTGTSGDVEVYALLYNAEEAPPTQDKAVVAI